jgi:hypothetical protein
MMAECIKTVKNRQSSKHEPYDSHWRTFSYCRPDATKSLSHLVRGRLHGAFFMCGSMSDKPFNAEAYDIGGQASATNGVSDATNGLTDMKNAPCNRPLNGNPRPGSDFVAPGKKICPTCPCNVHECK